MSIHPKLLEILCCPVSAQTLSLLTDDELSTVNSRISQGELNHPDGSKVSNPIDAGLITQDRNRIYRIDSDIPILLSDQSIEISNLERTA